MSKPKGWASASEQFTRTPTSKTMAVCRALLVVFYMAAHLACSNSVPSQTSPTLFLSRPSSSFLQGAVLSSIPALNPGSSFHIVHQPQCTNDTFTIGESNGELSLVRTINFTNLNEEGPLKPQCLPDTDSEAYFISIKTFYCFVIVNNVYGIPVVINAIPTVESLGLMFLGTFYNASVVEGVSNSTVTINTNMETLAATTLPVNNLVIPQYRLTGQHAGDFQVTEHRSSCRVIPSLVATRELRRAEQTYYEITLEAYYGESVSTTTTIGIEVLDKNDQVPQFTNTPSNLTITEDASFGIEIPTQLQASDNDSKLNAELLYSISTTNVPFTIHPLTGQLSLYSPLDYEQESSIEMSVVISDQGSPRLSSHTNITVFINNANEIPPVISIHTMGQISVPEDAQLGSVITTLTVADNDSTEVEVTISNLGTCNCFDIIENTTNGEADIHLYSIVLVNQLDFETTINSLYRLVVTALDIGEPELSADYEIGIVVTDVNEIPSFPQAAYEVNIKEGVPIGTVVTQMFAADPDVGSFKELTYSMSSPDTLSSLFMINSTTGTVYTTDQLDYEAFTTKFIVFHVSATDSLQPELSTTTALTIHIDDQNDNTPSFPMSTQNISVMETHNTNTPIYFFATEDQDEMCNGAVGYSIIHSEPNVFRIDSYSGNLYLRDYSSLDLSMFDNAKVIVRASDLGDVWSLSSMFTLYINFTQENKEAPILDPILCPCLIQEDAPSGQTCPALSAHDSDSSNLQFSITMGNKLNHFSIDPVTGVIRTETVLDREQTDQYSIAIRVSDGEFFSQLQTLNIWVVDINDSPPSYSDSISISAPTDLVAGDFVGSIAATHLDVGFNGLTNHQFYPSTSNDILSTFKLDPLSGKIYAKQPMSMTSYYFVVTAQDVLQPVEQSTSEEVTVSVSGMKNNPPLFKFSIQQYTVASDLPANTLIAVISALDSDLGSNGVLTYSIVQGSGNPMDLFQLTPAGELSSNQSFSALAGNVYTINVSATDSGSTALTAYQEIILTVYASSLTIGQAQLVYNPSVSPCHYNGSIQELADVDLPVTTLPSHQGDQPITYSIIASNVSDAFSTQPLLDFGVILYTEPGFGETVFQGRQAVFITLRATYGDNFHQCSVSVFIEDINNHAPQFEQEVYLLEVYDVTPVGSSVYKVAANDVDSGINGQTVYEIISPNSAPFELNSETGDLEVVGSLEITSYSFIIRASDSLSDPPDGVRSSTATVQVTVLDSVNRQPIISVPTVNYSVNESVSLGHVVTILTVTDTSDSGSLAMNRLCIASGNTFNVFLLPSNGRLTVGHELDYETQSIFELTVMAYDSTPNPKFQTKVITVTVEDINDEPPVFTSTAYTAVLAEDAAIGTPVITVQAIDRDSGLNGEVRYSVSTSNTFSINDRTGEITTASILNREAVPLHTLTVTATDQSPSSYVLSTSVQVTVTLLDINDNAPQFITISQIVNFLEDTNPGTELLLLEASDRDEGVNGEVQYSIVSGNEDLTFALDSCKGSFMLLRALDYEIDTRSYQVTFNVHDLGAPQRSSSSPITVTFNLQDVNDHYPIFTSNVYRCSIREDISSFSSTCQVDAMDLDLTGNVQYSLLSPSQYPFVVHSSTGEITPSESIDGGRNPHFTLRIRAEDSGSPPLSSVALVHIAVEDVNNKIPVFESVTSSLVPENLPFNTLLFFVHAFDSDENLEFSSVSYTLFSGDMENFRLDSSSGAVFLTGDLDYQRQQSHDLMIVGSNSGGNPQTTVTYTVNIMDINENLLPPIFQESNNPSVVSVSRDSQVGSVVTTLRADDPDMTQSISYFTTGGNGYGFFRINVTTGTLYTSFSLMGIEEKELHLQVIAIDSTKYPLSSETVLTIVLTPPTESKPFFTLPVFYANSVESVDINHTVAVISAEVNQLYDANICYSISGGNEGGLFGINTSTGAIFTALGPGVFSPKETYTLTVRASKQGIEGFSTALVIINLGGANFFRPAFLTGKYDTSVFETYPVDSAQPFLRVFAWDNDIGKNGRLTYSLQDGSSLPFGISETTGDIHLTSPLNSTIQSSYSVTVTARDNGTPSNSASTTLTVTVIQPVPSSASSPVIVPPPLTLLEDTSPPMMLTTLVPVNDITHILMYRFLSQPNELTILPNSGEIYLTSTLDYETQQTLSFDVEVWDGAMGHFNYYSIQVNVQDVNDNIPLFTTDDVSVTVSEGVYSGDIISSVSAYDTDSGQNRALTFSLIDSEQPTSLSLFTLTSDGVLTVTGDLDREVSPEHVLTAAVQDGGNSSSVNYARITVTVSDINDHNPEFPFPISVLSIFEDTPVGSVIHTVSSFDPDIGEQTSYSLGPGSFPFEIRANTGEIVTTSFLDTESQAQYQLSITAQNTLPSGGSSVVELTVDIMDVLDSNPILANPDTVLISENLPAYTKVLSIAEPSNNRPVYYSIVSGNSLGNFFVEPLTGTLRTSVPLDREEIAEYSLTVQGSFAVGFETSRVVTVAVGDENDNSPTFLSRMLKFDIPENTTVGEVPTSFNVNVTDRDAGENSTIGLFQIAEGQAAEFFSVDMSGNLFLLKHLGREEIFETITFELFALDSGTPSQYSSTLIQVNVLDSNDRPQFERDEYSYTLSVPVLPDVQLFTVKANDLDLGVYGEVEYSISGGNGTDKFAISSSTGEISVSNNFALLSNYLLNVRATDGGGLMTQVTVNILVKECGFRDLQFSPSSLGIQIMENLNIRSIVIPSGDFSLLEFNQPSSSGYEYSLTASAFDVDLDDGEIFTRGVLDRENQEVYQLVLQAKDRSDSERIAQAEIVITLLDENDNAPMFVLPPTDESTYTAYVRNNDPVGYQLLRVLATDRDKGNNAKLTYSILEDPSSSFEIDSVTGVIFLNASFADTQFGPVISISVQVTDGGEVPLSSTAAINIYIVDSNAPRFSMEVYNITIPEDIDSSTEIVTVVASAASSRPLITYRIESNDPFIPFRIGFRDGAVTVIDPGVDYETRTSYSLMLLAEDSSTSNLLLGRARLDVTIMDINDNSPVFEQINSFYTKQVNEDIDVNFAVLTVTANDIDSVPNAMVTYLLDSSQFSDTFNLDPSTGMISTINTLDYEQFPIYEFNVLAVDSGFPQRTGSATVRIGTNNVNDNPPIFTAPSNTASVSENSSPGTNILFVTANDQDMDRLEYNIISDELGYENFAITSDGEITLNQTSISLTQCLYQINVSAFDGLFYGYTRVAITVLDTNDNSPQFNQTTYTGSLTEGAPLGTYVTSVFATDNDKGDNAQLTYSITSDIFNINPMSGVITVRTIIDREVTPSVSFLVIARDGGGRTGRANVIIMVTDINDNVPIFIPSEYQGYVVNRSPQGTSILTVTAVDADEGDNGRIVYTFVGTTNQFPFQIDANGVISVGVFSVDFDAQNAYNFTVAARDSGIPPFMASLEATVMIAVTDIMTSQPVFTSPSFVKIPETAGRGDEVVTFNVSDCGLVRIFEIVLQDMEDFFKLDAGGRLIVDDTPGVGNHSVTVQVRCPIVPGAQANQMLTIEVIDLNTPPEFSGSYYSADIDEGSNPGTIVQVEVTRIDGTSTQTQIMAEDPDLGANGTITYQLQDDPSENGEQLFRIDPNTGELTVNGPIDFDSNSVVDNSGKITLVYVFKIKAVDGGTPSLTADTFIILSVNDINDLPPEFERDVYDIEVAENTPSNDILFTVQAQDNDTHADNKMILYSLSGDKFAIDNSTGAIRANIPLDREVTSMYSLTISASDGVGSDTATLNILITDVNDQPPLFNQSQYVINSLEENYPIDMVFLQVFTTDADEGNNSEVSYSIIEQPGNGKVTANSKTGEIRFLVSPDYEISPQLEFQVRAADIGGLDNFATVAITLLDLNDNSPVFNEPSYTAEVFENRPPGTNIIRVDATDRDSSSQGIVTYSIAGEGAEYFNVMNGVITSRQPFDRETNTSLEIIVVATDLGVPNRSTNTSLLVNILDENDQKPQFGEKVYEVQVSESEEANLVILTVGASDRDEGINAQITYRVSGEGSSDFYTISNPNGNISIALQNDLDHERISSYNLTLRAIDGGFPELEGTAILLVRVLDENDNLPEFEDFMYSQEIYEDAMIGSSILTVTATDRDTTNQIIYSIENQESYPELSIEANNGTLFVAGSLDFETTPMYVLKVFASDQPESLMPAMTEVIISVMDVNDNPPHFLSNNSEYSITENNPPDQTIFTLEADDVDTVSAKGQITFSIQSGNVGNTFDLDEASGTLKVLRSLDRENIDRYDLTIVSEDRGTPSLTASINITVIVLDQNDNAPTGGHQDIYLYLLNGKAPTISLGKVFVNDSDIINDHAYTLISNSSQSLAVLADGTIQIKSETPSSSMITVMISDGSHGEAFTNIRTVLRNITANSLAYSFSMQLSGITPQYFVDNNIREFIRVITNILINSLPVSEGEVDLQVFSIAGSGGNLNVFVLVENRVDSSFIHPNLVQHLIHINRKMIEESLRVTIRTEYIDLCASEGCNPGLLCSNSFKYTSTSSISFGSRSATYLGLTTEHSMLCQPEKPSPCQSLTGCVEPAYCSILATGPLAICQDTCSPNPCKNGGVCQPQTLGYYCQCRYGYSGRNCELTGATFNGSSYAIFPSLPRRLSGSISLELSTNQDYGVLFYVGRFDSNFNDFIALELVSGLPSVIVSYGSGDTMRTGPLPDGRSLSDLIWHKLTVDYNPTVSLCLVFV